MCIESARTVVTHVLNCTHFVASRYWHCMYVASAACIHLLQHTRLVDASAVYVAWLLTDLACFRRCSQLLRWLPMMSWQRSSRWMLKQPPRKPRSRNRKPISRELRSRPLATQVYSLKKQCQLVSLWGSKNYKQQQNSLTIHQQLVSRRRHLLAHQLQGLLACCTSVSSGCVTRHTYTSTKPTASQAGVCTAC